MEGGGRELFVFYQIQPPAIGLLEYIGLGWRAFFPAGTCPGQGVSQNTSCEFVICTDFLPYISQIPASGYILPGTSVDVRSSVRKHNTFWHHWLLRMELDAGDRGLVKGMGSRYG